MASSGYVRRLWLRRWWTVNPSRVDSTVDLVYGLLIAISVGLIVLVGDTVGLAFGFGVLLSYLVHVVWKMARFDPDWMTTAVKETVEATVDETVSDAVETELSATVEESVDTTVEQAVEDSVGETLEQRVTETVDETVAETVEETLTDKVETTPAPGADDTDQVDDTDDTETRTEAQ